MKYQKLLTYCHTFSDSFNVNLKMNSYMSTIEYLIWQCDISLHLYLFETEVKE